MFTGFLWRRVRDSNPRDLSVYSISSAAPSTTRTTLRVYFRPVFFPEICSKIRWRENRRDGKKYSILRFSVLRNIKENQGDEIPSFCRNFECCTFDHSDNSPYLFSSVLSSKKLLENSLGRKQERRQKIFDFEIFCVEEHQGEAGGRKSQVLPKFRVSPVMTASIRFHIRLKHGKACFAHTILSVLREKVKRFLAKRLTYTGQCGYNNCVL